MSNLREKAREVKSAGEAKRGEFQPTGVPLAVYDFWLSNSNSKKACAIKYGERKENFCHFWRIVAFWGPLRWLGRKAEQAFPFIAAALFITGLISFAIALFVVKDFWLVTLAGLGLTAGIAVLLLGFLSGISLALTPYLRRAYDLPKSKFMWTFFTLGLPASVPGYVITKTCQGIGWAFRNYPRQSWAVGAGLVTTSFFLSIGLTTGLSGMFVALGVVLGLFALVAATIITGVWISTYIEGKRELDRQKFDEFKVAYREEYGRDYVPPASKPSRIKAILRGIGDFIILIGQVVRVNKWKICPTVEIKTGSTY